MNLFQDSAREERGCLVSEGSDQQRSARVPRGGPAEEPSGDVDRNPGAFRQRSGPRVRGSFPGGVLEEFHEPVDHLQGLPRRKSECPACAVVDSFDQPNAVRRCEILKRSGAARRHPPAGHLS